MKTQRYTAEEKRLGHKDGLFVNGVVRYAINGPCDRYQVFVKKLNDRLVRVYGEEAPIVARRKYEAIRGAAFKRFLSETEKGVR